MGTFSVCIILPFILSISASLGLENNDLADDPVASLKYNNRASVYSCERPGTGCLNCRDRSSCVPNTSGGGFQEYYYDTCTTGTICMSGQCVTPPKNPPCNPQDGLRFTCTNAGVFPDPGDCKSYHMCATEYPDDLNAIFTHTKVLCEGPADEYAFNPRTGICDTKLTTKQCDTFPIPLCKLGAGGGPLLANPTFFYNCEWHVDEPTWLYPKQHRCPNGKRYTAASGCR